MLKLMRDSFQHLKWILVAVVAVFILFIFVDWGAGGTSGPAASRGYAARVNGETITYRDYDRAMYYAEQNYRQIYGANLTQEMLDQMGLPKQVLNSLVDQRLMLQQAQRLHLTASAEEVRKKILEIPILKNPDGSFIGPELYSRYVTANLGFASPAEFEDQMAKDITVQKMESALSTSVIISPKMADAEYRRISESAKIRYLLYPASREVATVTVTPAEVDAFYKANQSKYSHSEQRDVKYLLADFNRLRSQIIPGEDELKKRYDASVNDFKTPEQAHALHILIKVDPNAAPEVDAAARAKAESLVKQLRAGADFAALAKQNSADPQSAAKGGDLDWFSRGQMVPEFENAAFTLPLNQISDPVKTQYGYHIIKVIGRRPAATKSFEEAKPELAAQVAEQMAKDQARDLMTQVAAKIRQNKPATAEAFAAYANDKISSNDTLWFQKTDTIPGIGANPALSGFAFSAKQNDVGEMIGTQRGIVIPFLYGIRPAGVTALAEIRDRVTQDAKMAKAREIAFQALQKAAAGAASVDAVAAKVGLPASDTTVNRQGFIGGITGDTTQLVNTAFSAPVGQLEGPVRTGDGAVVFSVTEQKKVTDAEVKANEASYIEMIRGQQSRNLRAVLLEKLRKEANVDINDQVLQSRGKSQQGT